MWEPGRRRTGAGAALALHHQLNYDGGTTEFGEDGGFDYVILHSILTEYTRVSIHLHKVKVRVLFLALCNVNIE